MAEKISYYLKGVFLGGCSCDWGCPCNFEAPPTKGFCEGGGIWQVEQGHYGDVPLDGLRFGGFVHSPAALHLGNVTLLVLVDDRADARQREAIVLIVVALTPAKAEWVVRNRIALGCVPIGFSGCARPGRRVVRAMSRGTPGRQGGHSTRGARVRPGRGP